MRSWGEGPSERNPGRSLTPAAVGGHSETAVCEPGAEFSPGTGAASPLILDLSASRSVRKKLLLVISHPVHGILLQWLGQANGRISDVTSSIPVFSVSASSPGPRAVPVSFTTVSLKLSSGGHCIDIRCVSEWGAGHPLAFTRGALIDSFHK